MRWILAGMAAVFAAMSAFIFGQADQGLQINDVTVDGVPLRIVREQAETSGQRPGVVVAHGFAGSARLMAPFGDSLARRGAVVVLLDFTGHGANTVGAPDTQTLASDLETAVNHLRSLPGVHPERISLVGHSMGAGAVTRYAGTHQEINGTVAISLGDAEAVANGRPRHLLLLVGAAEFPGFHEAARQVDDSGGGTRLVTVPGVEHISILYSSRTHEEAIAWLSLRDGPAPAPANRITATVLLLVAFGLGFVPLAGVLFGPAGQLAAFDWWTPVWALGACTVGVVVAALIPQAVLPIAVAGYIAIFAALAGAVLMISRRGKDVAPARHAGPRIAGSRLALSAAILILYSVTAIALPLHLGMTHAMPSGDRWWLLPLIVAGFVSLAYGCLRRGGGGFWATLSTFAIAVVALTAATILGLAPGFLLLILPLTAILMAWQAAWSVVMARHGAPHWLTATVGAILPAWPAAVTLPLT